MTTRSLEVGHERDLAALDAGPASAPVVPDAAEIMAHAGTENFTVASRLLPAGVRQHLFAIYGFARLADEVGDDTARSPADRLAALDWLDAELLRAADGDATHRLLVALTATLRECHLPLDPFQRLIEANRRDQVVTRYDTFDDLVGYCALSANPIGELVLRVMDAATPERLRLSDRVCTGLQIVEHLQDVGEDLQRGRIYIPLDDLVRFDCTETDLAAETASLPLRALVRHEAHRGRDLLSAGTALVASLRGRMRVAVAGYVGGGLAVLDAIKRADGDVLGVRCKPRPHRIMARTGWLLAQAAGERGGS